MLPLFRTPFSDVFTVCTSCKYRIYGVVYQSNFVGLPTTLYTRPHFQISRIQTLSKISSTIIKQRRLYDEVRFIWLLCVIERKERRCMLYLLMN